MEQLILEYLQRPGYQPQKAPALAKRLKIPADRRDAFQAALEKLAAAGRIKITSRGRVRPLAAGSFLVGTVRRSGSGAGTFLPHDPPDWLKPPQLSIGPRDMHGAHTGDEVLVRVLSRRRARGERCGRVEEILQRATTTFVGTYFEEGGQGFVRIDGTAFPQPVPVGDPGAKGARPHDKIVVEMLQFPTPFLPGEAVVVRVLGKRGQPGVDTLSIIHQYGLPQEFPDDVLQEARTVTARFDPEKPGKRRDLTKETIVTIDPADARDFDDAISLKQTKDKHWHLGVHIADVSAFVRPGSRLDEEAQQRGNSVYLPDRVIPMLPELLSNGLASLQQGRLRFTKSVFIEFSPEGIPLQADFCNSVIRVTRRFAYEEVLPIIRNPDRFKAKVSAKVRTLLVRMHQLAMLLRRRRFAAGALNLDLPEVKLELDEDGRVTGAHEAVHDESHQIIEEFMLAANMAVAEELSERGRPFLRRVHASPDERKLRAFAQFVEALGYPLKNYQSRRELQQLLKKVRGQPTEHAVNYALLRSLKQAEYSATEEGHYALAVDDYCHFTSPIRRYPDLTVHRALESLFAKRKRPPQTDITSLERLARHCSLTERRATNAERELTQVKLLTYMSERIGEVMEAVITGVESFGLFCRGLELPVEGLLHVTALDPGDFFEYDRTTLTMTGRRSGRRYRLGDILRVEVAHVDVDRRQLDFRLAPEKAGPGKKRPAGKKRAAGKKNGRKKGAKKKPATKGAVSRKALTGRKTKPHGKKKKG